jgi:RNA polymerase sigma-70 factor (ECF subfamily)
MPVRVNEKAAEPEIPLEPLRRREPVAFERLVRRHESVVLGLCQSMGLGGADMDDAAAEVFANVFRALPNFEGRSSLTTWVYRIACRTIPKVRARVRKGRGEGLPAERIDDAQRTPAEESETAELYQRLWKEVGMLDDREAMAIELYYRREMPVEDVATSLECPAGTVKTLLFRARQKLRERLAPREVVR